MEEAWCLRLLLVAQELVEALKFVVGSPVLLLTVPW